MIAAGMPIKYDKPSVAALAGSLPVHPAIQRAGLSDNEVRRPILSNQDARAQIVHSTEHFQVVTFGVDFEQGNIARNHGFVGETLRLVPLRRLRWRRAIARHPVRNQTAESPCPCIYRRGHVLRDMQLHRGVSRPTAICRP